MAKIKDQKCAEKKIGISEETVNFRRKTESDPPQISASLAVSVRRYSGHGENVEGTQAASLERR